LNTICRPSRTKAIILVILGLLALCLAMALPFLLASPWLGLVLMGLPLMLSGGTALLDGAARLQAWLSLDVKNLQGRIPSFRGFAAPPARPFELPYTGIQAVMERQEIYYLLQIGGSCLLPLAVLRVYAVRADQRLLECSQGVFDACTDLMQGLASQSGLSIETAPTVHTGCIQALLGRRPPWD
jgi:hypothetical protein